VETVKLQKSESFVIVFSMPVQTGHRFNVEEYYRTAETGVLRPDARVELLNGQMIDLKPQQRDD
jgi:hypothetical protein